MSRKPLEVSAPEKENVTVESQGSHGGNCEHYSLFPDRCSPTFRMNVSKHLPLYTALYPRTRILAYDALPVTCCTLKKYAMALLTPILEIGLPMRVVMKAVPTLWL